ncbi:hypothetical protein [Idiomarina aminovorans]|uniref:hypothetical protein n=1 Tax=Idiomarina aminovorans TaxID=2914829 RepID=UPI0020057A57|nr:hypothetical protein [Idiomarina sp. ATCH4]MCK7460012.1 hypothetical protein [Idiomarina sp. ATCH4]
MNAAPFAAVKRSPSKNQTGLNGYLLNPGLIEISSAASNLSISLLSDNYGARPVWISEVVPPTNAPAIGIKDSPSDVIPAYVGVFCPNLNTNSDFK